MSEGLTLREKLEIMAMKIGIDPKKDWEFEEMIKLSFGDELHILDSNWQHPSLVILLLRDTHFPKDTFRDLEGIILIKIEAGKRDIKVTFDSEVFDEVRDPTIYLWGEPFNNFDPNIFRNHPRINITVNGDERLNNHPKITFREKLETMAKKIGIVPNKPPYEFELMIDSSIREEDMELLNSYTSSVTNYLSILLFKDTHFPKDTFRDLSEVGSIDIKAGKRDIKVTFDAEAFDEIRVPLIFLTGEPFNILDPNIFRNHPRIKLFINGRELLNNRPNVSY